MSAQFHGFFFKPPLERYLLGHQLAEIWKDQVYAPIINNRTGLTILDIGANIGMTAYYFQKYANKVYSLEPSLEHFEVLSRMVQFNEIKNVVTINKALYYQSGKFPLFHAPNVTTYSLNPAIALTNSGSEMVDCMTLEELFTQYEIAHVDLMKLDVEGTEGEIIGHESFAKYAPVIDTVVLERHVWSGRNPDQIVLALEDLGYRVSPIQGNADLLLATHEKNKG